MLAKKLQPLAIDFRPSKRRKSLAVKIIPGKVVVAYPQWVKPQALYAWLNNQADWILEHHQPAKTAPPAKPFTASDSLWWQGEQRLFAEVFAQADDAVNGNNINGNTNELSTGNGDFYALSLAEQKRWVLAACKEYIAEYVAQKMPAYEAHLGLYAKQLKLRPYKSRWGSCNHKGLIAINTLLAMAPSWIVDYVIVHELCHLKHPNHSPAFWREVDRIFTPAQVRAAKQWLQQHGHEFMPFI